jgi:pyruvate dehydrogenase E2 component (dihydrolipoamide acetyltransferase)
MQVTRSGWRRISTTFWRAPDNPQIFGSLDVDARPVERFLAKLNRGRKGVRVTPTAVAVRMVAHVLGEVPELNCVLRRGSFTERDSIDVFVIVSSGAGTDLSGVRVESAETLGVVEIAEVIARGATQVRGGHDPLMGATKRLLGLVPAWALRPAVGTVDRIVNELGVDIPGLGLPREPFGSAMVSSLGMFGLTNGFGPLSGIYRVPIFLIVGAIEERPVAEGGVVLARSTLPFTATIDHRFVDGAQLGHAAAAARAYLANPGAFEPTA